MKTSSKAMFAMALAGAMAAGGCVTSETDQSASDDTSTETAASSLCREVKHFNYQYGGGTFSWNVTTQLWDGRQFVDERKIGGNPPYYRQYRVSPVWSDCPHANENVRLTSGTYVLNGIHVCLPDGREEFHGADFQRLLVPVSPYVSYNCD